MPAVQEPVGPFTTWTYYGYGGWMPTDYATLSEAIAHDSYGDQKHISRPARYIIVELPDDDLA